MKNKKKSYIWNTISGMLNASQSAITLIFISHNYGVYEAGMFSIAYAIGLLCMTFAKYGQRNYQVTDVSERFSFYEYKASRVIVICITVTMMFMFILIQVFCERYMVRKAIIILLFVVWKMIDVVEDLYYGMYQQLDCMDIGAKRYSQRLLFSTVAFCALSFIRISFVELLAIVIIISIVAATYLIRIDYKKIAEKFKCRSLAICNVKSLVVDCLPLCIGTTLGVFVGNLPKYLIDRYLDESNQAFFGYVMMPSFVVMLLSNFIFQPLIKDMGVAYNNDDYKYINKVIRYQLLLIFAMTSIVILMSFFVGIPVLDILYNVKLATYKKEMIILLFGGACYAIAQFIMIPITIIRRQKDIAAIYVVIVIVSLLLGHILVRYKGMLGASILYLIINFILAGGLFVDYYVQYKKLIFCRERIGDE